MSAPAAFLRCSRVGLGLGLGLAVRRPAAPALVPAATAAAATSGGFRVISASFSSFSTSSSSSSSSSFSTSSPSLLVSSSATAVRAFRTSAASWGNIDVPVPAIADSISEGEIGEIKVQPGEYVAKDGIVVVLETDKASVDVTAPEGGIVASFAAEEGDIVQVGDDLFSLEPADAPEGAAPAEPEPEASTPEPEASPAAAAPTPPPAAPAPTAPAAAPASAPAAPAPTPGGQTRTKMPRIRRVIAGKLKETQNTAASLTTFNEIDMSALMNMRTKHKEAFLKKHGVKLGFMSAFIKASAYALEDQPVVNAYIDGDEIVYNDDVNVAIAVATPKGLAVPVLKGVQGLTYAGIEKAMGDVAAKARNDELAIEDMIGGTFTISNGGVFGSLFGTPIINGNQSAILGMHGIFDRPVAINGQVEIRPMMYVALTYDHRLIDGREAVTFLRTIKEACEDPHVLLM